MNKNIVALFVGFLFALGLGISGMTQTQNVHGFLDLFGNWNPALMGVMGGAIAVHSILYFFIRKRSSPIFDVKFHIPTNKDIDQKILIGSAIFGLGWGWAGICPGPGIVAMTSGNYSFFIFVASMLLGMKIFKLTIKQ